MRHLLTVILALVFVDVALAQRGELQAEPFRRANRIVVLTADAPSVAYAKVLRLLGGRGYTLKTVSDAAMVGSTDWNSTYTSVLGSDPMRVRFAVMPDSVGSLISFTGDFGDESSHLRISRQGMRQSPYEVSFRELDRIARAFEGGEVRYARD